MTDFTFTLEWQCTTCRKHNTHINPEVSTKVKKVTGNVNITIPVVFVTCPHCDAGAEFELP